MQKMLPTLFLFLFLLFGYSAFSQKNIEHLYENALIIFQTNPDSAYQIFQEVYKMGENNSSDKWMAQATEQMVSYHLLKVTIDSAEFYNSKCLELYTTDHNQIGIAKAINNNGKIDQYLGNYQKALNSYEQALKIFQEQDLQKEKAILLTDIGRANQITGEFEKAMENYNQSLEIGRRENNPSIIAKACYLLAGIYGIKGNWQKGVQYIQESISLYQTLNDEQSLATVMAIKSIYLFELKNYDAALKATKESIPIIQKIGNDNLLAVAYGIFGDIYLEQGDVDLALDYNLRGLDMFSNGGNAVSIPTFLRKIGQCYAAKGKIDESIGYYTRSADLYREHNILSEAAFSLGHLGQSYVLKGAHQKAIQHCYEALQIGDNISSINIQNNACECLYKAYNGLNNYKEALKYLNRHKILSDSLKIEDSRNEMARWDLVQKNFLDSVRNETEKQEILFTHQAATQKRNQRLYGIGIGGILIFSLLGYQLLYTKKRRKLSEREKEIQFKEASRLRELDKMKTNLYTNITHEFRTPLTVITGIADELKNRPDQTEEYAEMIKRNGVRLLNLVNQILDLAKLENGILHVDLVNGDIIKYLKYIISSFQSYADHEHINIHFLSEDQSILMDYDVEKILQIFSNLISNAIKFTPKSGDIYIQVERKIIEDLPVLSVKVKDTGIGISKQDLTHIFNRFYQAENKVFQDHKGSGIGLSLTKELVGLFDGSIHAHSEEGKGTQITVQIPITNNIDTTTTLIQPESIGQAIQTFTSVEELSDTEEITPYTLKEMPRLLIAEDNPDVVDYLKICLENEYQIEIAQNGQIGIDKAIQLVPDIIISDLMMPLKDGYELCHTLKTDIKTSHIPIIMLTAKADFSDRLKGLETGADAYLLKPFQKEELKAVLKNAIDLRIRLQKRYSNEILYSTIETQGPEKEDVFIFKLRELIILNLSDSDFGIPQVCRSMQMSRSQLHNKIKALTGFSTSIYIRKIRLNKSLEKLKNPAFNISEIAYSVGFSDPAYFSRCFTEEFGKSPTALKALPAT